MMEMEPGSLAQWARRRIEVTLLRGIQRRLYAVARPMVQWQLRWSQRTEGTAWAWLSKPLLLAGGVLFLPGVLLGVRRALVSFVPRPSDIFIVTYPKSGTNWMQMILYQLTTDGDVEGLSHLLEAVPWLEAPFGRSRDMEDYPAPRVIKSHLSYKSMLKGPGKYIYIMRDGKDVVVSQYYQDQRFPFASNTTFSQYFERWMRGRIAFGLWFDHVAGWWVHRHDPNVLFLRYEELQRDTESTIRRIAAFCNITLDDERLARTLQRSSFAFMKQHERKIDPLPFVSSEIGVAPQSFGRASFLRKGTVGDWKAHLSTEQRARFEQEFNCRLAPLGIGGIE